MTSSEKNILSESLMTELCLFIRSKTNEEVDLLKVYHKDGRANSAILESVIIDVVLEWAKQSFLIKALSLEIYVPEDRHCYDVMIRSKNSTSIIIPINIKISNIAKKGSDNLGIDSAITFIAGGKETKTRRHDKDSILDEIDAIQELGLDPLDYYYLVVDKNPDENNHVVAYPFSILTITNIIANGAASNGIQACWWKNACEPRTSLVYPNEFLWELDDLLNMKHREYRSYEDSINLILNVKDEVLSKKIEACEKERLINSKLKSMSHGKYLGDRPRIEGELGDRS